MGKKMTAKQMVLDKHPEAMAFQSALAGYCGWHIAVPEKSGIGCRWITRYAEPTAAKAWAVAAANLRKGKGKKS